MTELKNNETYKSVFINPWTYVAGAMALVVLQVMLLSATGKSWGVTTSFAYWGAWMVQFAGFEPESWLYFTEVKSSFGREGFGFFSDQGSITNLGIIAGALIATLMSSQFKVKTLKNSKQFVAAILGGLCMGVGARLAFGCNIGSMFAAVPTMALTGWVFVAFIFLGAWVGSRTLTKFFI